MSIRPNQETYCEVRECLAGALSGNKLHIHLPPGGESLLRPIAQVLMQFFGRTNAGGPATNPETQEMLLVVGIDDMSKSDAAISQIDSLIRTFIQEHISITKLDVSLENGPNVDYEFKPRALMIDYYIFSQRMKPLVDEVNRRGIKKVLEEHRKQPNNMLIFLTQYYQFYCVGKITFNPSAVTTETLNPKPKEAIEKYIQLQNRISELTSYIDTHGGWYNSSLDSFPGFDTYLLARAKNPSSSYESILQMLAECMVFVLLGRRFVK